MSLTGTGDARDRDLRYRIEQVAELLVDQGSLVRKKRGDQLYWYLRYYDTVAGCRKQRSLYIGSDGDAERARELLNELRAPAEFLRETLRLAELACNLAKPLLRRSRRATSVTGSGASADSITEDT